jgi:serine/threonine protein kinase
VTSLIGKEIGKYRITERIGRGGMADVYLGIHTHLDRKVAIKVLHSFLLEGGDFIERFKREAKAVASLRHPNIVQVYDFDIQDDIIIMVMEYIDGTNLQQLLADLEKKGKRLPIKQIGSIINDIAGALDYAHSQGMLHRDVKPSNILIDKDGKAYLTDFGIAKIVGDHKLTATGTLMGTPAYMSPEQGRGEDLTEESDIYSLGIVAFEMLTGRVPFDAKTPIGIVQKQISEPVPDISSLVDGVPVTAQEVINKALAKTPKGRYTTAEELVGALKLALQALESIESIPMTPVPTASKGYEESFSAPTVAMSEAPAADEFDKPTVQMQESKKPKKQVEASPPESKPPEETPAAVQKLKRKIPLWGVIAAGAIVVGIAAVVLIPLIGPNTPAATTKAPTAATTKAPTAVRTKTPVAPVTNNPGADSGTIKHTGEQVTVKLNAGEQQVAAGASIQLSMGWLAANEEQVADFLSALNMTGTLDGKPLTGLENYWGEIEQNTGGQGETSKYHKSTWLYPLGVLSPTTHTIEIRSALDHPVTDGFDSNGDGKTDEYSGEIYHFTMSIVVAVTFDADHTSSGLYLSAGFDRDVEIVTVGDSQEQAWRTGNGTVLPSEPENHMGDHYMEFLIDDGYIFNVPTGSQVRLEIEYLDEGTDKLNVQYDAQSGGQYHNGSYVDTDEVQKTNSGEFKTATFILDNARFANGNNGADFRIDDRSDGAETIRRVTVTVLP